MNLKKVLHNNFLLNNLNISIRLTNSRTLVHAPYRAVACPGRVPLAWAEFLSLIILENIRSVNRIRASDFTVTQAQSGLLVSGDGLCDLLIAATLFAVPSINLLSVTEVTIFPQQICGC